MKKRPLAILFALVCLSLIITACSESTAPVSESTPAVEKAAPQAGSLIADSYIVVFKDQSSLTQKSWDAGKAQVRQMADAVLTDQGIATDRVGHIYASALSGCSVKISAAQAELLRQDSRVAYVAQDQIAAMNPGGPPWQDPDPVGQTIPWGITRVGGAVTYTGSHVAWILDTGVDLDNPDLNVDVSRSANFIDPTVSADDDNGHGTHVAGTVAAIDNDILVVGVAAGATVIPVKVLDRHGSGAMSVVIAGIDFVAANGSAGDVANMSLSGSAYDPIDTAVLNASNNGIYFALAAGNESDDANDYSPARVNGPYVYTVSAGDINDNWAYFSNYANPPVDYNAPGYSILSLAPGGGTATMSGTSMAAPHVCGLLLSTGGNIHGDGYINGDPDGTPDPIAHR